jgi:hypothetical protein
MQFMFNCYFGQLLPNPDPYCNQEGQGNVDPSGTGSKTLCFFLNFLFRLRPCDLFHEFLRSPNTKKSLQRAEYCTLNRQAQRFIYYSFHI